MFEYNFQVIINSRLSVPSDSGIRVPYILCTDFFNKECTEDAEEECSDFLVEVPLSEEFNSAEFDHFCR